MKQTRVGMIALPAPTPLDSTRARRPLSRDSTSAGRAPNPPAEPMPTRHAIAAQWIRLAPTLGRKRAHVLHVQLTIGIPCAVRHLLLFAHSSYTRRIRAEIGSLARAICPWLAAKKPQASTEIHFGRRRSNVALAFDARCENPQKPLIILLALHFLLEARARRPLIESV